ncbi:MAG: hypothetical protein U5O39_16910 [Gammaproteobacteria bacterium]|nr:hypothetical protein [Gammaproteobacteria bacterium]
MTTGIAIDAGLLPTINEIETALWNALPKHLEPRGIRCRIRPQEVALEIESEMHIDPDAPWAREARRIAAEAFQRAGYGDHAHRIVVEPYRRGSAFLVETLEVR